MTHDPRELADFIDRHVAYAIEEVAVLSSETNKVPAIEAIALALFRFVATTVRSVESAELAEADFRKRAAVLSDPLTDTAH